MKKVFAAILVLALFGCSGLQTAGYRKNSEGYTGLSRGYKGPGQGYSPPNSQKRRNDATQGPFQLSYPVEKVKVTRGFFKARRPHQGVDFDGERNDPILAAHEGYVIYKGSGFRGFGKMIIVQYSEKWASLYAHLNSFAVEEGDYVRRGEVIGKMGKTGRATGTHLHFELMKNKIPIDPMPLLKKGQRLVEASY